MRFSSRGNKGQRVFAAKVSFPKGRADAATVSEAALSVLGCWYKHGQILEGDWATSDSGPSIDAYVAIPERDSLGPIHDNRYAKEALDELKAAGHGLPAVTVLGSDPTMDPVCSCESPSALVLFTHYLSTLPPVRCLDCFRPVPLYRLPYPHDEEHLGILHWAADYRACDTLQMHCTTGERFGEVQLYRHDSSLNREGRDLAKQLEALTGKPVYYWLFKARGRSREAELARKCPSCGGRWRLKEPLFKLFDFRCKRCRLLSGIACSVS